MTKFAAIRVCFLALFGTLASACGGHALNLEPSPQGDGGAGAVVGSGGGAARIPPSTTAVPDQVYTFRVDDERLYWLVYLGPTLRSCLKDDCAKTQTTFANTWGNYRVGIGTRDVYWTPKESPTSVVTCPRSGCVGAPASFVQDPGSVMNVFDAHGDYFYWSSSYDILRCPSSGCAATPERVAKDERVTGSFGFRNEYLYWPSTEHVQDRAATPRSVVRRARLDGKEPAQTIVTIEFSVGVDGSSSSRVPDYALDERAIYWLDGDNHILSCPLEGCGDSAPRQWVTSAIGKSSLAVDAAGLYWLEGSDGEPSALRFCEFEACAAGDSIAVVDAPVDHFGLDERAVYWTRRTGTGYATSIQRVAKPKP